MSKMEKEKDPTLNEAAHEYLSFDPNPLTRAILSDLLQDNKLDELHTCLKKRIAFGTAGLRAKMAAGYNSMNDIVILQTTQGIVKYLNSQFGDTAKERVSDSLYTILLSSIEAIFGQPIITRLCLL